MIFDLYWIDQKQAFFSGSQKRVIAVSVEAPAGGCIPNQSAWFESPSRPAKRAIPRRSLNCCQTAWEE